MNGAPSDRLALAKIIGMWGATHSRPATDSGLTRACTIALTWPLGQSETWRPIDSRTLVHWMYMHRSFTRIRDTPPFTGSDRGCSAASRSASATAVAPSLHP
eukprot:9070962-Pyramimonas_sp.AAC.1